MGVYTNYPYEELGDSPSESVSTEKGGNFNADVHLLVPWNYRHLVVADIVGNAQIYPRLPQSGARAVSASTKPFQARILNEDGSIYFNAFDYAEVNIKYKIEAETSDFISESIEPTAELITTNPADYYRGSDAFSTANPFVFAESYPPGSVATPAKLGDKVIIVGGTSHPAIEHLKESDQGPSRMQVGMEYSVTFYRVINIPNAVLDLMNCVNDAAIPSRLLGLTFQPETLLFRPPTATRKWNYTTFPYWELKYKFSWKKDGWNRFWNPKAAAYDKDGNLLDTSGGYDYYYTKNKELTTLLHASHPVAGYKDAFVLRRYDPFTPADFSPAFQIDMNLSPVQ